MMQKYGKIFLVCIAIGLMASTAGAANLIDYWNFDETSGTTLGNQVAGRPGVTMANFTGTEWSTDVPTALTHSTGALSFDQAQAQSLRLSPRSGYDGATGEFTMSFWLKPSSTGGLDMRLWGPRFFSDVIHTCLRVDMTTNQIYEYTSGNYDWTAVTASNTVTPDAWQNLTLTFKDNTLTTFVDGVAVGTKSNCRLDYPAEAVEMVIGGRLNDAFGATYSGLMDDISVWDKALKPWDVEALASGMDPTTFTGGGNVPTYDFANYSEIVNINFVSDASAAAYSGTSAIPGAGTSWNAAVIDAPNGVLGEASVDLIDALDDSGTATGISVYLTGAQGVVNYGEEAATGELYRSGLQVGSTAMNEWQIDGLIVGETYDMVIYHSGVFALTCTSGVDPELGGIASEWTGLSSNAGPECAAEEIWAEGYNYSVVTITPTDSTVTGSLRSNWSLLGMQIALQETEEKAPGDANGDGKVDGSDVTILAGNWQKGVGDGLTASWEEGDFNGDGKVDGSDVTILAGNWQYGVTAAAASVPEPSTIVGLFSLLLLGLVKWARKAKKIAPMLLVALVVFSITSNASAALRNYWNFEEGDWSSEYITDVAGTNTGTLEGFVGDEWEADVPTALTHSTNSLQFKQVNNAWVNLGDLGITTKSEAASPVDAMTLSMWIKPTSFNIENRLWSVGANDLYGEDVSSTMLRVVESKASIQYFGPDPKMPFIDATYETESWRCEWFNATPNNSIQVDQWHHLTMVWNKGEAITTYLNGELVGHYRGPYADVDHDGFETLLGGKFNYYGNYYGNSFDGYIDDVAIWDQALSPEAVAELSNGTAPNVLVDTWAGETLPTYAEVVNVDFKFGFLPQYDGQGANPQAGTTWNEPAITGPRGAMGASQTDLVDSNGVATSIDVSVSGFKCGFAAPADAGTYWKEANAMFDDRLVASVDTDNLWSIDGLEVGETYDIFFYGQGECDIELTAGAAADSTSLNLENGLRILGVSEDTPEDWDESITYTILTVTPTDSTISGSILPSAEGVDYMGLAGIQICKHAPVVSSAASVPEPATWCGLIALFFGGLFLRRRIKR